ncbi:uncharacterized protein [Prorops nasuta]|uniref:uncharacterized protein n=1 Tax=Prorops nasuta TaxID=863751 RepID=UPI0034CD941F
MFRRDFDSFTGLREIGREIEKTAEIDKAFKPPPGATKTREEDKSSRKNREALFAISEKSEKKSEKQQKSDATGKNAKKSDDEKPKKKKSRSRKGKRGDLPEDIPTKGGREESLGHSGHRSNWSDELGAIAAAPKQGQRRPNSSLRAPRGQVTGLEEEARAGPADSLSAYGRTVRFTDSESWRDSSVSSTDYEDYASESEQKNLRVSSTSESEDEPNSTRPDFSGEDSSEESVCTFTSEVGRRPSLKSNPEDSINEIEPSSLSDHLCALDEILSKERTATLGQLELFGQIFPALIDTGASRSYLGHRTLERIQAKIDRLQDRVMRTADGTETQVIGVIALELDLEEQEK